MRWKEMGVHLKWVEKQLSVLLSSNTEHFFSGHVVVLHHLPACQQEGLQKILWHWTARVHFIQIDEPFPPCGKVVL